MASVGVVGYVGLLTVRGDDHGSSCAIDRWAVVLAYAAWTAVATRRSLRLPTSDIVLRLELAVRGFSLCHACEMSEPLAAKRDSPGWP